MGRKHSIVRTHAFTVGYIFLAVFLFAVISPPAQSRGLFGSNNECTRDNPCPPRNSYNSQQRQPAPYTPGSQQQYVPRSPIWSNTRPPTGNNWPQYQALPQNNGVAPAYRSQGWRERDRQYRAPNQYSPSEPSQRFQQYRENPQFRPDDSNGYARYRGPSHTTGAPTNFEPAQPNFPQRRFGQPEITAPGTPPAQIISSPNATGPIEQTGHHRRFGQPVTTTTNTQPTNQSGASSSTATGLPVKTETSVQSANSQPSSAAPAQTSSPPAVQSNSGYTFQTTPDGDVSVYQNGKLISSGTTPGYAHDNYGYVLPNNSAPQQPQATAQPYSPPETPPASSLTPSSNPKMAGYGYAYMTNPDGTVAIYQNGVLSLPKVDPAYAEQNYGYVPPGGNASTTSSNQNAAAPTPQPTQAVAQSPAPPNASPPPASTGLPTCPSLAIGFSGLPSCTNGQYVFVPTGNNTTEVFQNGEMLAARMPAATATARYGYVPPDNGNPSSSSAPTSTTTTAVYMSAPSAANAAESSAASASSTSPSQSFYIESGTGTQLTADQIRTGSFPPGTYFIESGTGRQVTQADFAPSSQQSPPVNNSPPSNPPPPPVTSNQPSAPVYTFAQTPDGNVEIYQNGQLTSTGTPQYAAQFGYTGPGATAPVSNYNQPPAPSAPSPASPPTPAAPQPAAPPTPPPSLAQGPVTAAPSASPTYYVESGTGTQFTADQIRSGSFPPGTYFIESGTGKQVSQADLISGSQQAANIPPTVNAPPSITSQPTNPVYTFSPTADGNVEIYENGQRVSTGTPQYAAQFGYTGPGATAPVSNYNQPLAPSAPPPASPRPPTAPLPTPPPLPPSPSAQSPGTSTPATSQTFYIESGTGTKLTADQIRTGSFPPGTYFIESGTGKHVSQADLFSDSSQPATEPTSPTSSAPPLSVRPASSSGTPSNTEITAQPTLNLPNGGQLSISPSTSQNNYPALTSYLPSTTPELPSSTMAQSTPTTLTPEEAASYNALVKAAAVGTLTLLQFIPIADDLTDGAILLRSALAAKALPGIDSGIDVTVGSTKIPVRQLSDTLDEIVKSLKENGFSESASSDGQANIWTKGDTYYSIRPSGSSGTKIDMFLDNTPMVQFILK